MILTVTLNAAVDKTYRVENFTLDRVHRPDEQRIVAGGKGINVARVFQALGGRALATGFLGGYNGRFIAESLKREGIESDFVATRGESRVCIAIVDSAAGSQTEVNEAGPEISSKELQAFRRRFERLIQESAWSFMTLSGSIPPGVPATIYAELIETARKAGVRSVLDASGEPLLAGAAAKPWMVKPNIHELSYLLGQELSTSDAIVDAAKRVLAGGTKVVPVTCGKDGSICAAEDEVWQSVPPPIDFVSAVGSGDSFLGGFLWEIERGRSIECALKTATAAGAANAASYGAGFVKSDEIHSLADAVKVTRLDEKVGKVRHAGVF